MHLRLKAILAPRNLFKQTMPSNLQSKLICIIAALLLLTSCATRKAPAPVVDVSGSVPLSQRLKNSIKTTEYIVKKGETLYSIAWRANLNVNTIAGINNISSPYKIFPGQKIILSAKSVQPSKYKPPVKVPSKNMELSIKKPVAHNKKQAYGGNVSRKSMENNQKVRKWYWPVKGAVISAYSLTKQGNKGIDIAGQRGDPVRSSAKGKVVYTGDALRGYGKLVIIKHNDDYLSAYAHNDQILVKEQQIVKAGDIIAKMGDTGSQRVMLHFEVRFRGKPVNPMKYLEKL